MPTRRTLLLGSVSAALSPLAAGAQAYPSRAIRLIVPFSAGAPDTVARIIGQQLSVQLGQPVVIENRPGANGVTGTHEVVKAPPDGHTLLIVSSSFAVNPSIYRKLPYDPLGDLEPVTSICATEGYILVVHPSVAAKTVQELVALAREAGNRLAYGSPGVGNTLHLAGALLNARAGIDMAHVPYRGGGPALSALMSGEVTMAFLNLPTILPQAQSGTLRILGLAELRRSALEPDIPTMSEVGLPDFAVASWCAIFVPRRTPGPVIARFNAAIREAVADEALRARFLALGVDPRVSSPEELDQIVARDFAFWGPVIRSANITL